MPGYFAGRGGVLRWAGGLARTCAGMVGGLTSEGGWVSGTKAKDKGEASSAIRFHGYFLVHLVALELVFEKRQAKMGLGLGAKGRVVCVCVSVCGVGG